MKSIEIALVMCGGLGARFGDDKSLFPYNNRTMISYVLDSINSSSVKKVILQANKSNKEKIEREAKYYLTNQEIHLLDEPPTAYRNVVRDLQDLLNGNFFLLGGNQPIRKEYLIEFEKNWSSSGFDWGVSIYPLYSAELMDGTKTVSILKNNLLKVENSTGFIIHPPFILDTSLIKVQEAENYKQKIDQSVCNTMSEKKVYGHVADMPPEFDDINMLQNTLRFIDRLIY